jgi:hypothetical protein
VPQTWLVATAVQAAAVALELPMLPPLPAAAEVQLLAMMVPSRVSEVERPCDERSGRARRALVYKRCQFRQPKRKSVIGGAYEPGVRFHDSGDRGPRFLCQTVISGRGTHISECHYDHRRSRAPIGCCGRHLTSIPNARAPRARLRRIGGGVASLDARGSAHPHREGTRGTLKTPGGVELPDAGADRGPIGIGGHRWRDAEGPVLG